MLMVLAYGLLPSIVDTSELQNFCATIQTGDQIEELIDRASNAGYSIKTTNVADVDYILVMNKKEMSRFVCEVTIQDKNAASARYMLNKPSRETVPE